MAAVSERQVSVATLVPASALRRRIDPETLPVGSTAEIEPGRDVIGQPRALAALQFALGNPGPGFNVFVAGASGSGRMTTVVDHLNRVSALRPAPPDIAYLHNFDHPDRPIAISLPAGVGPRFAAEMDRFAAGLRARISGALESDAFDRRRQALVEEVSGRRGAVIEQLQDFARQRGFTLEMTPGGVISIPLVDGHPLTPAEVQALSAEARQALEARGAEIQDRVLGAVRSLHQLEAEANERMQGLVREVVLFAVAPVLDEIAESFGKHEGVLDHLERIREDIPKHIDELRAEGQQAGVLDGRMQAEHADRYRVNVLVDNSERAGAPVVVERNPTYYNLVGRVQYRAMLGMLETDFRQIKAGALHRASGGFLVLDCAAVLTNLFAWDALKRALSTGEVRIENLGEQLSSVPTASLAPQPVRIDVKVVLIGSQRLYRLLLALDEEFADLFKVKAEFAPDMPWTDEALAGYTSFLRRCVEDRGLPHFDRTAIARIIEEGARLVEDQTRLSTRLQDISDLAVEAGFWARSADHGEVTAADVDAALAHHRTRSDLVEERLREMISTRVLMVETEGARVGQVNGLSVLDLGDHRFAVPSRLTASVAPGRGSVDSIERQIELSGPIHSKGVLTLAAYLGATFSQGGPPALRATLSFEQSYDEVEGDSASSAELYALLSALSDVPVRQNLAVTGSVDQMGHVQPVGGVNEKIEGFYRVCADRGDTSGHGVVMPRANLRNLMLAGDVVQAVADGRFQIHAVSTIAEGVELLTGLPLGEPGRGGRYAEGTLGRLVQDRLARYAEVAERRVRRRGPRAAENGEG